MDNVQVNQPTTGRAIKVYDVQSVCSQRLPFQGYFHRFIREDSLFIIIALIQANTPATSEVYSGDNVYFSDLPITVFYPFSDCICSQLLPQKTR